MIYDPFKWNKIIKWTIIPWKQFFIKKWYKGKDEDSDVIDFVVKFHL